MRVDYLPTKTSDEPALSPMLQQADLAWASHPASADYAPRYDAGPNHAKQEQRGAGSKAPVGGALKRCCDVAIAGTALLVMAPMMIAIALLIVVTMGRPILFSQKRLGFGRRAFSCLKFRTMVPDAQERLVKYLSQDPQAAKTWEETQKLQNDPRITWLGHVLRKTSLDELPQLINVMRGEMSCIGPRPVLAEELERYGPYSGDYAAAKPGLTGMWQVSGRSRTSYAYRVKCDRYYVRRWSLALDLIIILRTLPALLRFEDTA